EWTVVVTLDLCARTLDERPILHARRARGYTRHAAEARIEVADEGRRHRSAPLEARLHQVDAAARRVHLLVPQHVSRTRRQAEAAMHARVDECHRGLIRAAERRDPGSRIRDPAGLLGSRFDTHTGPRPALRMPWGSSACFTDAPSEPASPSGPHTSRCCFNCGSARSTTTWRKTSLRDR